MKTLTPLFALSLLVLAACSTTTPKGWKALSTCPIDGSQLIVYPRQAVEIDPQMALPASTNGEHYEIQRAWCPQRTCHQIYYATNSWK